MTSVNDRPATAGMLGLDLPASHVGPELIRRAAALRPKLLERQAETERLGRYPEETHQDFIDSELYRVIQPRMFGGYECDIPAFLAIVRELARGCPSTAWCYGFGVSHQLTASMILSAEAQKEMFAGETCLIACTSAPTPIPAEKVDGMYHIQGTFAYGSGSPYSTHFLGSATGPGGESDPLVFLAPRAGYTLRDDWGDVLGLKGSGSNTLEVDAWIPERFVLHQSMRSLPIDGGSVGSALHQNSMYAVSEFSFSAGLMVSIAVGAGWAACDEYRATLLTRRSRFPAPASGSATSPLKAEVEEFQRHLGYAIGKLSAAEAIVAHGAEMLMEFSRRNLQQGSHSAKWDAQMVAMLLTAAELTWNAVQNPLVQTIGTTNIIRGGERMQRYVRDLQTFWSHLLSSYTYQNQTTLGRLDLADETATSS